ncbi:hypothetical protein SLEP1_g34809 [Rubroshorea leprosula]|uniref:VQ domain-containing protein n=1 Tax=Rubroshorea leprosula TaxID=152421 RepID=A0AAV5KL66_9ROSI|nr:hypothetical protein SLEP1_g34809 [Rubroshorea leprosula]
MDSGNSGSIQSSSGGSEEYDSRAADSISAFLNNTPSIPNHNQPPPHNQTHSSASMFDSLYFDPSSRSSANPNSLLNLDMVWAKGLRSESNCNELGGFMAATPTTQQLLTNQQGQNRGGGGFPPAHISQGVPEKGTVSGSVSGTSDQIANNNNTSNNMVRNPKKRSRASRRAPTTVLTTDTTNFRAMVQEFTGIPAPPFTSPFPRSRLDLFGMASSMRSTPHLDPSHPPYLLRPYPQKIQQPQFVSSSSSMVDAIAATTRTNNNGTSSSTSINFQLPSDQLGLLKQPPPQNLLQNPVLNFQSLLQPPPKYPLSDSGILGTKLQGSLDIPSSDSSLRMGVLDEFGLSHGHGGTTLSGLQNMISPDGSLPRSDNITNPPRWGDAGAGSHENHDQGLLKSIHGNGKLSFSGSSSDFRGGKGPENATTRGEGMVESWICSSD